MKTLFFCLLSLACVINSNEINIENRYQTRTGTISFEASVPSFEAIETINKSTTIVLDSNGNIAALALIKGFHFPIALMQEHFNENYIESDEFPKAVLKGTLKDFDQSNLSEENTYTLEGAIELHGVKKEVFIPITLLKKGDEIELKSTFILKPEDFNIEIPGVVSKKIAKEVQVTVEGILVKK